MNKDFTLEQNICSKNKKILIKSLSILIMFVIIFTNMMGYTFAKSYEQKKAEEKAANIKKEIEKKKKELNSIKDQIKGNLKEVVDFESRIRAKNVEITKLEQEIDQAEKEIQEKIHEVEELEKNIEKIEDVCKNRLVSIYEQSYVSPFTQIFEAENIMQAVSNVYMIKEISRIDNELLNKVQEDKEKSKSIKNELTTKKKLIEENKSKIVAAKKEEESLKQAKIEANKKLSKDQMATASEIEKIEAERVKADREVQEIIRRSQMQNTGVRPGNVSASGFMWPTPTCTYITARYAESWKTGYPGNFHTGIDIGCRSGTTVVAAADGVVVSSRYAGGYGNCVVINHDGVHSTLYAHGSQLLVKVGQYVKRGQAVLKSGNTGRSFGPHLHFEVRLNGRHVNPLLYVKP